ncbi:MAG: type II secretion system F family protein [Sedimentibacter sp.]|uniref:type II secretion system F family protein n=1 Tax=Sedimentibacter sp. TaxID=1960295 RepID=UPI003158F817
MEIVISALIAVLIYIVVYTGLSKNNKEQVRHRVSRYFKENNMDDVQEQFIREKTEEENKKKKQRFKLASQEFSSYIASSGIKLKPNEFIMFWAMLTLVPMILVILFGGSIVTGIALAVIGIAIPPFIINNARKKRDDLFNTQLAQATVMMGNSIKGGFTFLQSMESVAEDMQPPISTEFARVLREIHYGVKQTDALNRMVERTKNRDLELLVSAVLTSAQVGSNLSEILDTISATIRDRIRIKLEIKTLTAQGRVSGLIIGLLPLVLVLALMVISPGYFAGFFESDIGKILVVVSLVLEITGFAVINNIVNIKM